MNDKTDMSEEKIKKKLTKKQIKIIVAIVIILVIAFGFLHQYIVRTPSHIKTSFDKYKTSFTACAEFLSENANSEETVSLTEDEQKYTTPDRKKILISYLISSPANDEIADELTELEERCKIQSISSTHSYVTFTDLYNTKYYYSVSGKAPSDRAKKITGNWFYSLAAQ